MTWPRTPRSTWGQLPFCVSCSSLLPPLTELCLFTLGLWNCQLPHLRGAGLPAEDVRPRVAAEVALPRQPPPRLLSRPRRVCGEQLHAECTASVSLETGAGHRALWSGVGAGRLPTQDKEWATCPETQLSALTNSGFKRENYALCSFKEFNLLT